MHGGRELLGGCHPGSGCFLLARVPSSVVGNAAKYAEGGGAADDNEEEEEDIKIEVLWLPDVDWSATSSCAGFFWLLVSRV